MFKNNYPKNHPIAISIIIIFLTFVGNIIFAMATAEPERHFDSFTYLIGYNYVQNGGVFAAYPYVGKFPEIFLQTLYLLIGVFEIIKDEYDILIFHSIIFNVFYVLSVLLYSKLLKLPLYYGALIYSLTLPGLPLQLGRQSIYLAVVIILFVFLKRRFSNFLTSSCLFFVTPFFHLGSAFVPIQFHLNYRFLFYIFVLLTSFLISLNVVFEYKQLAAITPVLIYRLDNLWNVSSSLVFTEIFLICLMFFNMATRKRVSKQELFLLISLFIVVFFVSFPVYRFLYGFFFFFFPFAVLKELHKINNFDSTVVISLYSLIILKLYILFYSYGKVLLLF